MKHQERPPMGTKLFCVREHLYYTPGGAGPDLEYIIFEGEVVGYHNGHGWVDMKLMGRSPEGNTETVTRKLKDIGTKVFHTAVEAAGLARDLTEDYERRWAWTARWGDVPLRRPWERLLKEAMT